jgi:hypothetical protein
MRTSLRRLVLAALLSVPFLARQALGQDSSGLSQPFSGLTAQVRAAAQEQQRTAAASQDRETATPDDPCRPPVLDRQANRSLWKNNRQALLDAIADRSAGIPGSMPGIRKFTQGREPSWMDVI